MYSMSAITVSKNGRRDSLGTNEAPGGPLLTGLRPVFQADPNARIKVRARNLNFFYGTAQALHDINLDIREKQVTALIGPSGSGKTTFLRTINRLSDVVPGARAEGELTLDGQD